MERRKFITGVAASAAVGRATGAAGAPAGELLSGVQIGPHSLFDEGIGHCLDFLQQNAATNALFVYPQTYHMGVKPRSVLALDHPAPPRDPAGRKLPDLWVDLPDELFEDLPLRHAQPPPGSEFAGRDLFDELAGPCRERGIKLYARILEAGMRRADRIPGYRNVATVDTDGNQGNGPCWNHPDYREWVRRTIEHLMRRYPVDGLQYGAERVGPLSEVLFRGIAPACFCRFCTARNDGAGIDADRARAGYRELFELVRSLETGGARPTDGVLTAVLRTLFRYPEVLAWYREWFAADEEIQAMVYRTAKAVRPAADVGQHVDHQRSSWDIFYRAIVSYGEMAQHNDFIKPIVYHDILGPRLKEWVIDRMQGRVLGDLDHPLALDLFYALFGHDREREPAYAELMRSGLSPEYVYREVKRCVDGVGGDAMVYAGIGFDVPTYVPGGMEKFPSEPEGVTLAVRRALDAGAAGVVASREYDEMTLPNLRAFRDGVLDR